ncbi:anion permease [Streptomyces pristinaespiralis]|uniref:Phosphate transporter n=2 Tax=Streptomyces pristinaespiralis TaxID=38300 RepID=B5HJA7_STRE2|nr:inorganic phosphate transporter [Streptomyces pristinaespiralis]ALC20301.1 inorganic phosphate transporter [Streptomyces pristinaespiralis]EDY66918.1 phosphate transporter [Streptomyces pristinaespiralis ATCC 25486]QMU16830.1 inorganic phosphate transporter [Streptomyces pristinaespiralis]
MELTLVLLIIVVGLTFDFTNGFHDAANAIATSISTRALTPRTALAMAAVVNFLGAFLGTEVAKTVGSGIIGAPEELSGLLLVLCALVGAIGWNIFTWWRGLPTSSSHALIGGLVGAALAASATVHWTGIVDKVLLPMLLSPLVGVALGYSLHTIILWAFRRSAPRPVTRRFRAAQTVSAAAMGLGHGLQDAQKTMGVIVLAMVTAGWQDDFSVPLWVIAAVAAAMAAGTYTGGRRIITTLGRRIVHLDPPRGFAAETAATAVLYTTAFVFKAPISTTQTITAAILGAGATRRIKAVRWQVARSIGIAWILTFPGAGLPAAALYLILHAITGL